MKLADLREIASWATTGRWYSRGRYILRNVVGTDATPHTLQVGSFSERADAEAAAALHGHADALLALVATVDGVLAESDPESESPAVREMRAARGRIEEVQ